MRLRIIIATRARAVAGTSLQARGRDLLVAEPIGHRVAMRQARALGPGNVSNAWPPRAAHAPWCRVDEHGLAWASRGDDRTSGDIKNQPGHPPGTVAGEVEDRLGNIHRSPEPPDRVLADHLLLDVLGDLLAGAFGDDGLRGDAVRPDPVRAGLEGDTLGEQLDAGLGRGISIGECAVGLRAAAEEIVTMLPRPRCFIPGSTAATSRYVAIRFSSTAATKSSSRISSTNCGRLGDPPALATRTSVPPNPASASRTTSATCTASVRSPTTAWQVPPSASIAAHTAANARCPVRARSPEPRGSRGGSRSRGRCHATRR